MMLRKWHRPRAINKTAPFVSQGMNALPDVVAESNATAPAGDRRYEVQLRSAGRVVIGCCAGESAQVVQNRERRMRLRPSCLRTSNRWGAELWHASVMLNGRGCGIARSVGASIVARVLSPATVGSKTRCNHEANRNDAAWDDDLCRG